MLTLMRSTFVIARIVSRSRGLLFAGPCLLQREPSSSLGASPKPMSRRLKAVLRATSCSVPNARHHSIRPPSELSLRSSICAWEPHVSAPNCGQECNTGAGQHRTGSQFRNRQGELTNNRAPISKMARQLASGFWNIGALLAPPNDVSSSRVLRTDGSVTEIGCT
jgi:hypothetical protein